MDNWITKSFEDFKSVFDGVDGDLKLLNFSGLIFFILNCITSFQIAHLQNFHSKVLTPLIIAIMFTICASFTGFFLVEKIMKRAIKNTDSNYYQIRRQIFKASNGFDIFIQNALGNLTFYGFIAIISVYS